MVQNIFAHSSGNKDEGAYPAPLTVENISESDKKDSRKVVEALGNSFIDAFKAKEFSQEDIMRSDKMLTTLTCIKYNHMRQLESIKPDIPEWEIKSNWMDPNGENQESISIITATTRDLAAGYAMCELWGTKHIPLDRFTGFNVESAIVEPQNKE